MKRGADVRRETARGRKAPTIREVFGVAAIFVSFHWLQRQQCRGLLVRYNPPSAPTRERLFLRIHIAFGVLVVLAAPVYAQGVPDPGTDREFSAKLSVCNECHGANGVRRNATIPVIGGQPENYLLKQLHDFERGDRHDEVMPWMVQTLTPQEREIAAAFFAKQKWPARSAAVASTAPPPGIAVCGACHAADFVGARQADGTAAPRLAGQGYPYLVEAMRRFAEGERKNNDIMTRMMAAMSPAERDAIARYLSGL
ncbi:MAG TPA: c-type cytochrome [Vicinamibacterales bacterium]|nr:c-type cytochrome [Vicinamibacterales bacterium]